MSIDPLDIPDQQWEVVGVRGESIAALVNQPSQVIEFGKMSGLQRRRVRERTSRWLSAVVLVGTLLPPPLHHAHAGGHEAHEHAHHAGGCDGHHHHHHNCPDDTTGAVVGERFCGAELVAAPAGHVHFSWLLFEVTWPTDDEHDTGPIQNGLVDGACVIGGPAQCRLIGADLAANRCAIVSPQSLDGQELVTAGAPPKRPAALVVANLLCDTARHERSGVQLF